MTVLDLDRARAEADAAERRGAGTLWAAGPVAWENVSVGAVDQPEVVPVAADAGAVNPPTTPRVIAVQCAEPTRIVGDVPTALLGAILARLERAAPLIGAVPPWLTEAIGNPLTYDAATARRKDVCARVDPRLYRRLQAMKERLGLRTTAGAWEYVLRAGLAVGERSSTARPGWSHDRV